jgi:hypothetical protein
MDVSFSVDNGFRKSRRILIRESEDMKSQSLADFCPMPGREANFSIKFSSVGGKKLILLRLP